MNLDEAKLRLRVDLDDDDDRIRALIAAGEAGETPLHEQEQIVHLRTGDRRQSAGGVFSRDAISAPNCEKPLCGAALNG